MFARVWDSLAVGIVSERESHGVANIGKVPVVPFFTCATVSHGNVRAQIVGGDGRMERRVVASA
ncbi:hypothetical protein [Paraburkholderia aromaticivorans]|uniref:hypothetical protein n=1 Tax=Paraburkholderia aromaticivorans TaxID=2026199 RepID=UPI0012FDA9D7|nr:hypothetical protein [Paraburkholderia aromaticivorans]